MQFKLYITPSERQTRRTCFLLYCSVSNCIGFITDYSVYAQISLDALPAQTIWEKKTALKVLVNKVSCADLHDEKPRYTFAL